jgi:glycolate oxidase iron-sulfur subunit
MLGSRRGRCRRHGARAGRARFHAAEDGPARPRRILRAAPSRCSIPGINDATISLLTASASRSSCRKGEGCCGALVHHMGREDGARLRAGETSTPGRARSRQGLDAIVITASGCGTTIKDYGFMLRLDPAYAEKAARVSALAKDVTEYPRRSTCPSRR